MSRLIYLRVAALIATSLQGRSNPNPHAAEPIGTVREMYDGRLSPEMAVHTFRNIDRLFPTRVVHRGATVSPLPPVREPLRELSFADDSGRHTLQEYEQSNRVAGLLILKDGQIELEHYRFGNTARTRWMSMSLAKSVTGTLIGAATAQGLIGSLDDPVTRYVPALAESAYESVSIRNVLMMRSGIRWDETYTNLASDRRRLLEAQIAQRPGSAMELMAALPRAAAPGTVFNYSTGETQVAAEVLRHAVKRPIADYLSEQIWSRVGMESDGTWWLDSPGGTEIGGSGLSATLRDYGRFGLLMMNGGVINGTHLLPPDWGKEFLPAQRSGHTRGQGYGYFWWIPSSPTARADHAFSGVGIFGQRLYVDPTARIVIVVWGAQTLPSGGGPIDDWAFFDAVIARLGSGSR